jgi:phage major head subunit gpT-like protein
MQITPASLAAMFYSFDQRFQAGLTSAKPWSGAVATEVPSAGESLTYPLLDKIPRLRKWLPNAERVAQNASLRGYSLVNDDYELTVEVDRNKIEDDAYGAYAPLMEMMGQQSALWPDDLVGAVLQGGAAATALTYDGQPMFSTTHPVNMDDASKGTYQNLRAAAFALNAVNYNTVRAEMASYNGADGKPLGILPDTLVVPPQLEQAGRQILNADYIAPVGAFGQNAAGQLQTNTLKGSASLVVVPQLANEPTAWYLLVAGMAIKPFVFQRRKSPAFQQFTDPNAPDVFKRRKYVYGCDARGAAGYTLPFLAYRCVG